MSAGSPGHLRASVSLRQGVVNGYRDGAAVTGRPDGQQGWNSRGASRPYPRHAGPPADVRAHASFGRPALLVVLAAEPPGQVRLLMLPGDDEDGAVLLAVAADQADGNPVTITVKAVHLFVTHGYPRGIKRRALIRCQVGAVAEQDEAIGPPVDEQRTRGGALRRARHPDQREALAPHLPAMTVWAGHHLAAPKLRDARNRRQFLAQAGGQEQGTGTPGASGRAGQLNELTGTRARPGLPSPDTRRSTTFSSPRWRNEKIITHTAVMPHYVPRAPP